MPYENENGVMGYGTTDLPQYSETKKVCVMFPVVDLFVFVRCLLLRRADVSFVHVYIHVYFPLCSSYVYLYIYLVYIRCVYFALRVTYACCANLVGLSPLWFLQPA